MRTGNGNSIRRAGPWVAYVLTPLVIGAFFFLIGFLRTWLVSDETPMKSAGLAGVVAGVGVALALIWVCFGRWRGQTGGAESSGD